MLLRQGGVRGQKNVEDNNHRRQQVPAAELKGGSITLLCKFLWPLGWEILYNNIDNQMIITLI